MSPERKRLALLEQTGQFVFHGSSEDLDVLEPQQAHKYTEGPGGKGRRDGAPSIFASVSSDFAVFFAVVSKKNCPLGRHAELASFSYKDGTYDLKFKASSHTMSQIADDSYGWVYVFKKDHFFLREPGGIEYSVRAATRPSEKLRVTKKDILGPIEITSE